MKLLSCILVLLFFIQSFADSNIVHVENVSEGKKIISLLYPEDYAWVYERILVQKGLLQESLGRQVFETKAQALESIPVQRVKILSAEGVVVEIPVSTENKKFKIWKDTKKWSTAWERKYTEWFKQNVTKDYFVKFNIATDCADAAIALRWIFARIHGLPAGQTLSGTGVFFTNRSFKNSWRRLKRNKVWYKDQVFMASLRFLIDSTYTHTLSKDSYPVAITPEHLSEGSYLLSLEGHTGHAILVYKQNQEGIPLSSLNSTVPKIVRSLVESTFVPYRVESRDKGGLLKHLWVVSDFGRLINKRPQTMPGYSLEQYDPQFGGEDYGVEVLKRINSSFDPIKVYKNVFESTVQFIKSRISVVSEGYAFCKVNDCNPGTQNYEDWSTPSRDKQLQVKLEQEESLFFSFVAVSKNIGSLRDKLIAEKNISILGENYNYEFFKKMWSKKHFNSDPRSSEGARWALSANDFSQSVVRKLEEVNKPLLKKINSSGCTDQKICPKFSKAWEQEQTIFERNIVKSYLTEIFNYCDWRGLSCKDYYSSNIQGLSISGFSFYDYARFIFKGSFDPHSSLDDKKGLRSDLESILFLKPIYIGQSKSYLVSDDIFGVRATHLDSKEPKKFNISGQIITSAVDADIILFYSKKNEISLFDLEQEKSRVIYELQQGEKLKSVYLNEKKAIVVTNQNLSYLAVSLNSAETLYSKKMIKHYGGEYKVIYSRLDGDYFYIIRGSNLYSINLVTNKVAIQNLEQGAIGSNFIISNISSQNIYVASYDSEKKSYTNLIIDKFTGLSINVMDVDKSLEWFYGSDIFKSPIPDGFSLSKVNSNYSYNKIRDCSPCNGYINKTNLIYSSNKEKNLLYYLNERLWDYDKKNNKTISYYDNYVVEKDSNSNFFIKSKLDQKSYEVKCGANYINSGKTDLGLSLKFARQFENQEIPFRHFTQYLFNQGGEYIPFDSAVRFSFEEDSSEELLAKYSFIQFLEFNPILSNHKYNKSSIEIDYLKNSFHTGGLMEMENFSVWLKLK